MRIEMEMKVIENAPMRANEPAAYHLTLSLYLGYHFTASLDSFIFVRIGVAFLRSSFAKEIFVVSGLIRYVP